jgi:hypothetical protein
VSVDFIVYDSTGNQMSASAPLTATADNQWHYTCANLFDAISEASSTTVTAKSFTLFSASVSPSLPDMYIDTVSIRKTTPLAYTGKILSIFLNSKYSI